jgi:apolipoprotein N-acyltransferase
MRQLCGALWHVAAIVLSSTLINLAAPVGGGLTALAFIAFAPWLAVLSRDLRPTMAFISGLAMGMVYIIPLHWPTFAAAVAAGGAQGWKLHLTTVGFFFCYALPFALYAPLDGILRRRWILPDPLWALLRAALLASLICLVWAPFPYTPTVNIVDWSSLLQIASIGGEPLLLMLMLWPSAVIAGLLRQPFTRTVMMQAMLPLAIGVLLVHVYGSWRIQQMDQSEADGAGQRLSALPLQMDLPHRSTAQMLTRDRPRGRQSALEMTRRALAEAPRCELVIWPEVPLSAERSRQACGQGGRMAESLGRPLLMQCYRQAGRDGFATGLDLQSQVSAEWMLPEETGQSNLWHGKSSLVPFYEQPLFSSGQLQAGQPGSVFELDSERRLIPTLCYELHSRKHLRQGVFNGGNIVAHMASFTPFSRHPIDRWDLAMAQLRAAEFGLPILRATNRGPVGWIDANGRVRALSERFGRHAECQDIWTPSGKATLYTYIAPVAAALPATLFLLLGWAISRRPSRPS